MSLNPYTIAIAALLLATSFGAGMVTEARWSTQLILTNAEAQKNREIAALKEAAARQETAAQKDAAERAERERFLGEYVTELLEKATEHASQETIIDSDLATAIDRAGRMRNDTRSNRTGRVPTVR